MKQQKCPICGNYVEGKKVATFARKMTRGAVKKGSAAVTGAAIGSIIPGVGTVIGGAIGLVTGALMEDGVNEVADLVEDLAFDETEYEFRCPKCGHYWKMKNVSNQESEIKEKLKSSPQSSPHIFDSSGNGSRTEILDIIKECSPIRSINEGCSLTFADINVNKLINKIKSQYGVDVYDWQINSCRNVQGLVDLISTRCICSSDVFIESETKQEKFNRIFHDYLESSEVIIENKRSVQKYVRDLENYMFGCDDVVKSEFHFLQAICYLDYSLLHDDDKYLIGDGQFYINRAIALLDDGEYKLVKLMFESLSIDHDAQNIVKIQEKIQDKCPKIELLENTLFNTEYLKVLYEKTRFHSLVDSIGRLEEKKDFNSAVECLNMIISLSDTEYKLCGYELLMDYYFWGRDGIEQSKEIAFVYAKKGYELTDYSQEFNHDIFYHERWLNCLDRVAYCYLEGEGVAQDYNKAFEYGLKAANFGSKYSSYNLGEIYELGRGVPQNKTKALEWFEKSLELGLEAAAEKVQELKKSSLPSFKESPVGANVLSEGESEYLTELKACLEEDGKISSKERRLLNRLRERLGISEKRAEELEASLLKPELTEEEQEYLDEYKACIEEGELSPKEIRLLNRLRMSLGISEERAREIETFI